MKHLKVVTLFIAVLLVSGNAIANERDFKHKPDSVIGNWGLPNVDSRYLKPVNMSCGFKPFPPLGCVVGACVCDSSGNNCQWVMVCK